MFWFLHVLLPITHLQVIVMLCIDLHFWLTLSYMNPVAHYLLLIMNTFVYKPKLSSLSSCMNLLLIFSCMSFHCPFVWKPQLLIVLYLNCHCLLPFYQPFVCKRCSFLGMNFHYSVTASHLLVIVLCTLTTIFCMNPWNWGFVCEFLAETNERICFLNVCPDEVIRSLFYNKNNDSLITVSVYASENFSSLKCRSTKIECVHFMIVFSKPPIQRVKPILLTWSFVYVLRYIRRGTPDAGFPLFQSESLKWPGFVEFDDVNGKVLTYSAQDRYLHHSIVYLFQFYCFASV